MELERSLLAAQIKEETLPVNQQKEETLPTIWQTEGTLPRVRSSQTKKHEVTTKLLNNFFQRDSVENEEMSGQEQKNRWSVDWWVGFRILPLVEHSVKDEEKIIGQRQCPSKLSWGAGIWAALWLLWLAVSAEIYPNEPVEECSHCTPSQIKKKDQTKEIETKVTGVAGSQAPNNTSRKAKWGRSGRIRANDQDTESEDSE